MALGFFTTTIPNAHESKISTMVTLRLLHTLFPKEEAGLKPIKNYGRHNWVHCC